VFPTSNVHTVVTSHVKLVSIFATGILYNVVAEAKNSFQLNSLHHNTFHVAHAYVFFAQVPLILVYILPVSQKTTTVHVDCIVSIHIGISSIVVAVFLIAAY
jgi:hypothetical protein